SQWRRRRRRTNGLLRHGSYGAVGYRRRNGGRLRRGRLECMPRHGAGALGRHKRNGRNALRAGAAVMPKKARELSAVEVRRLSKPGHYRVGGVAGLLLQVTPTGARTWKLRATIGNRRRDVGLGGYPDVSLSQAREQARELRQKIREGVDVVAERQAAR